ncbi:hypothetical protein B0T26DRAFT_750361 [Lasiosphaeria miniovina]|uniref:Uncharacterized protein n=1 Tax=Lasiosphaeria miniovina TaxID=1954250 RepID=A0AA40AVZ3_9PEZI|nr:uncharacterized protein B0T26DRAFT_750361 [Lasiosphaeria miniovina]KAK0723043.1 hypothetical protein B0T26DRAFT_750361 [Lasiosphaeria miniovina]
MRTKYMLSELDNIEASLPVQYPDQIPDCCAPRSGAASPVPDPDMARESMQDVFTRSLTANLIITDPMTAMLRMGLAPVEYGADIKARSVAVTEAFDPISEF